MASHVYDNSQGNFQLVEENEKYTINIIQGKMLTGDNRGIEIRL